MLRRNIISLVAAGAAFAAAYFFIPDSFIAGLPFGQWQYANWLLFAIVAAAVFGLIHLILWAVSAPRRDYSLGDEAADALERIWSVINSLSDRDYDDFMRFMKTGNKPVLRQGMARGGLYGSELVQYKKREQQHSNSYLYIYRLKPDIFELLKRTWK